MVLFLDFLQQNIAPIIKIKDQLRSHFHPLRKVLFLRDPEKAEQREIQGMKNSFLNALNLDLNEIIIAILAAITIKIK